MRVTALAVAANGEAELNCMLEPPVTIGSEWQQPDYGWDEADTLISPNCSRPGGRVSGQKKCSVFTQLERETKNQPASAGSFGANAPE